MFDFPKNEEEILKFWKEKGIFQKSIDERPAGRRFVFFDGPPFATGLPHYGHLVAGTIKDAIPRYWTMKGYRVERRWGWDCHGLPVEYEVEKELGISGKKDIEEKIGVAKFNEACGSIVLRYTKEWQQTVERTGRWIDMDNAYKTMDIDYMESVWWVFKSLFDKDLIYEGFKILPFCPRCSTPLSNFEANMPGAYKEVNDPSVTLRFKIIYPEQSRGVFFLVWTTTPWTLPSNSGLAVGPEIDYVKVKDKQDGNVYILAEERLGVYYGNEGDPVHSAKLADSAGKYEVLEKLKGKDLVGLEYEPLFPYFENKKSAGGFKVVAADFVSIKEGTGIVHIAPAFGEEDYELGQKQRLPLINPVDDTGRFDDSVSDYAGIFVKDADEKIMADLEKQGKLVKREIITHPYPHCWRCETPLIYKAVSTWFVAVTKIKDKMIKHNKKIHWMPEHLKSGRFGKWLEDAKDWAISRNRYWGTSLPIWRCQIGENQNSPPEADKSQNYCNAIKIIGSIEELEKLSGQKITDLHKPFIDGIKIKCEKCGGEMRRILEVLDCWFESGAMPYAQNHYPFEKKENFEKSFPAHFIAEGIDQTRGWFYTLLVISTALFDKPAFLNVAVNGLVLAEDGKKMSKRLKNYPEPEEILNKYGADAFRFYILSSPVVRGETFCFSEKGVKEALQKTLMLFWNIFSFYEMRAAEKIKDAEPKPKHILDRWILTKLNLLIKEVSENLENYDLMKAARPIADFIEEFSTWYLRRSRERLKGEGEDKKEALETLGYTLLTLSKLTAPFIPFLAETIYRKLKGDKSAFAKSAADKESVHLEEWPKQGKVSGKEILANMDLARWVVSAALEERARVGIPVRQVLQNLEINGMDIEPEYLEIIKDEVNIKEVVIGKEKEKSVKLNTEITPELRLEGMSREIIRQINAMRKEQGLTIKDRINIYFKADSEIIKKVFDEFKENILKNTLAEGFVLQKTTVDSEKKLDLGREKLWIGIKKL